jgi:hypothetical protein
MYDCNKCTVCTNMPVVVVLCDHTGINMGNFIACKSNVYFKRTSSLIIVNSGNTSLMQRGGVLYLTVWQITWLRTAECVTKLVPML